MANGLRVSAILSLATLAGCASNRVDVPDSASPGTSPVVSPDRVADGAPRGGSLTLRCESDHGLRRHCDIDAGGNIVLSRRLSKTPCVQGRNWDIDASGVWVAAGCRAEFTRAGGQSAGHAAGTLVRCESDNGHLRHCVAPIVRGVELRRNVSRTPCIRGENWGWDGRGVWVDSGCRGDFEVF